MDAFYRTQHRIRMNRAQPEDRPISIFRETVEPRDKEDIQSSITCNVKTIDHYINK